MTSRALAVLFVVLAAACGNAAPDTTPPAPPPTVEPAPAPTEPAPVEPAPAEAKTCVRSGCSGTVCVEEGNEVMTTCEYKPEYDCYRAATCAWQAATASCGWTETAEIEACIARARQAP